MQHATSACPRWPFPSRFIRHEAYRSRLATRGYHGASWTMTAPWLYVRRLAVVSSAGVLLSLANGSPTVKRFCGPAFPRCESYREFMDNAGPSPTVRVRGSDGTGSDSQATGSNPEPPPQTPADAPTENVMQSTSASSLFDVKWAEIPDKLRDLIIPDWVKVLPSFMAKLQKELSMAPGSLAEEIWDDANNPEINPEIIWDCSVRVSDELCDDEKAFLRRRRANVGRALARYLDIPEDSVCPDDIPIISMVGSGGGLRALVAGSSSYLSTKEAGLFDCVTYTAGVSGSCWLQTLFYSSIAQQSHEKLIGHLKNRLGVHIAYPPKALPLLTYAPTSKYLLTGLVEKLKGIPDADFGIVDIYGLLLAARLLVPKGELGVETEDLKLSNQRIYLEHGQYPLPLYTAVRHEIPLEDQDKPLDQLRAEARKEAWFQWFEFSPYEFWCEELGAGIPTWAVGRSFENGRSGWRTNGLALPELRVPFLMGVWGSAFCATLSHYYKEIRPVMLGLVGFGGIDQIIAERDDDLVKVHMIDPAAIPNYVRGMRDQLPATCPESIFQAEHLQLMDAGMSNNLPIYPLLRPGRNVDVIIAFDSSADVAKDNWLHVCDGYAKQRGIKGWPMGAGWPPSGESPASAVSDLNQTLNMQDKGKPDFIKVEANGPPQQHATSSQQADGTRVPSSDLGYCNIWVGTTAERTADGEEPPSKLVHEDWEVMKSDAGITVIYFPFLPNPKVEGIDPKRSDFLSTWNFVYSPEQVDKVVDLARANFEEGRERVKSTIRAIYERKKQTRLEKEKEAREQKRRMRLRSGIGDKRLGEGDHADQFR